jgi:hypothetical protein
MTKLSPEASEIIILLMFNRDKMEERMVSDLQSLYRHIDNAGFNGKRRDWVLHG